MTLLEEILEWTKTALPLWQRDAVRRLFQQGCELSSNDYDELYSLLKASHDIPTIPEIKPIPLAAEHLPKAPKEGQVVVLKAMRDLKNVNRIPLDQKMVFAPKGMTIIYGGNGTGKSGYARVLKKACRARDKNEEVLPDAHDPNAKLLVPECKFDIEIGGVESTVKWSSGSTPPEDLSTIAVFDSHCARAYVTEEDKVDYLPYGLDVVESLAKKVIPEINKRLDEELICINVDLGPFQHLKGETEVGRLMTSLNYQSDPEKFKAISILSDQEKRRIIELELALSQADPKAKSDELQLSAKRLRELSERIRTALTLVDDQALETITSIVIALNEAIEAEKLAAAALRSDENLLPGTGEAVWKALFESARKFSTEVAYPEVKFPNISPDAVCPLCQQLLGKAGDRLLRFEAYIKEDAGKRAEQRRQQVLTDKNRIERANITFGLDTSLEEELSALDKTLLPILHDFQESLKERREWILQAIASNAWDDAPALSEYPVSRLRKLVAHQLQASRTLKRAADKDKAEKLKKEQEELTSRKLLSICIDAILKLITNIKNKQALSSCEKTLRTKPISDKSKELSNKAVTAALATALNEEFNILGIKSIEVKLKERTEKGEFKHRLILDLPTTPKIDRILSEGEQRAIALGSFFAELKLSNHFGGIVFDDPVSSLDHKRRKLAANRMALEAINRQVLVFTHDVVFLHQIIEECNNLKLPPFMCFLETVMHKPGIVRKGLPWGHQSYRERIDFLEKNQKRLEKLPWPAEPTEEQAMDIVEQYSRLRATIERIVQDVTLNATIQRFRDYIEVKRLEKVVGLDWSEVEEIFRLTKRCNDITEAHDPSSAKQDAVPTPDDLKKDIDDLKKLIEKTNNRQQTASNKNLQKAAQHP